MSSGGPGACPTLHDFVLVGPGIKVRLLPAENFSLAFASVREARDHLAALYFGLPRIKPERARGRLSVAEQTAQRDPFSPWVRVVLTHLLGQAGDPRAPESMAGIPQCSGGDFTEWLPISSYLYEAGRP